MTRFKMGIWLAGLLACSCAVSTMGCGSVESEARLAAEPAAPPLSAQEQEFYGGNLGGALGKPVVSDTTVGKTNDVSSNCTGSNTAPDLSFTWTPPYAGTFVFTTEGSAIDTVLTIHKVTDSVNVLGCNDDEPGGNAWSSLVLSNLSTTQGYTLVVDGYGKAAGAIKLNIWSPGGACPSGCNTPPGGGCYQSAGTCQDGICTYAPKPLGGTCDDGQFCNVNEICDGAGRCGGGTPRVCNTPPSACFASTGTCSNSGGCSYAPTGCTINGTCYANGQTNPANGCEICDVSRSVTTWSDNDGAKVGGGTCRYGSCVTGSCYESYCRTHADCQETCYGGQSYCR